jgi:methyl-accepting chemotaxis protein
MNEVEQMVIETEKLSGSIGEISTEVNQITDTNANKVEKMTGQMDMISYAVGAALSTVQELEENMKHISEFLTNITQIAEQTNLLALNAAIEAARAGEAGKGFSVVADEVRKLAEQSSKTAEDIHEIIIALETKTKGVVTKVQDGNVAIEEGNILVKDMQKSFEQMHNEFDKMNNYINREHDGLEQMTISISKMQENLEENAAISEEHAATTEEISTAVQQQNNSMGNIAETVKQIRILSADLRSIL